MSTHVEAVPRFPRPVAPEPRKVAAAFQPPVARSRMPLELTVEVLRGPFRPLVMWALFWGARPFSELMRRVPDVTKKALRRELAEMERLGLVRRELLPGSDRRAVYSLSPLGETLQPVLGAMYEWGLFCAQPRRPSQDRMRLMSGA